MYTKEISNELLIDMLANDPLSWEEKVNLLNNHNKKVFLDGFDKSTQLKEKVDREIKDKTEKRNWKELHDIVDTWNDKIFEYKQANKYKK